MKKNMVYMISVISLLCLPLKLYSATSELYQGTAPVASYSSADFNKALAPALTQVLVKVTANPGVASIPSIKQALAKPDRLIQSYNYSSAVVDGIKQLTLVVRFSPKLVNRLLEEANQSTSPLATTQDKQQQTLVWLAVKNVEGQPEVLNNRSNAIVATMQASAKRQNLSLLWPVVDLEDISVASPDQIWQMNQFAVEQASQRYRADAVLMGKLEQVSDGQWQGTWLWWDNTGNHKNWQTSGANPSAAGVSVLANLTGAMITVLPPSPSASINDNQSIQPVAPSANSAWVDIKVSGVYNIEDYANVIKYFRSLKRVTSVNAAQMRGDSMVVNVQINGGKQALINELNTTQKLVQDLYNAPNANRSSLLLYHWNSAYQQAPENNFDPYANPEVQSFPASELHSDFVPTHTMPIEGDDMIQVDH